MKESIYKKATGFQPTTLIKKNTFKRMNKRFYLFLEAPNKRCSEK